MVYTRQRANTGLMKLKIDLNIKIIIKLKVGIAFMVKGHKSGLDLDKGRGSFIIYDLNIFILLLTTDNLNLC